MELFQGIPYWPTTGHSAPLGTNDIPDHCEIAIIGGGISGMLCAWTLSRAGHSVVLIDGNRVGHGSTALNTGLIQYMSDDLLTELTDSFGRAIAASFYRASRQALDLLSEIARELPCDPEFRRVSSLYVAADPAALRQVEKEVRQQQSHGLPASLVDEAELAKRYHLRGCGAILTEGDIALNPFLFTRFMAETAVKRYDLRILENTRVAESAIHREHHRLDLPQGSLRYDRLIIATGYDFFPSVREVLPAARLIPTFAAVTTPLSHPIIPGGLMVWDSSRPYTYFRSSADGRLIAGGLDEPDTELDQTKARVNAQRILIDINHQLVHPRDLIPEFWYEAIFAESRDGLPYLGPHPEDPDLFLLHGIGGNGTVCSAIGARLALQFAAGGIDPEYRYLFPGKKRRL